MVDKKMMLDVKEVSRYLGVSQSTIRKMVREKQIPFIRILSKVLFNKENLDKWISKNETTEDN